MLEVIDDAGRILRGQLLGKPEKPKGEMEVGPIRGHDLRVVAVDEEDEHLFVCSLCYCYAQHRWNCLARECRGQVTVEHPARLRVRAGLHPQGGDDRRVSVPFGLTKGLMHYAFHAVKDPVKLAIHKPAPSAAAFRGTRREGGSSAATEYFLKMRRASRLRQSRLGRPGTPAEWR